MIRATIVRSRVATRIATEYSADSNSSHPQELSRPASPAEITSVAPLAGFPPVGTSCLPGPCGVSPHQDWVGHLSWSRWRRTRKCSPSVPDGSRQTPASRTGGPPCCYLLQHWSAAFVCAGLGEFPPVGSIRVVRSSSAPVHEPSCPAASSNAAPLVCLSCPSACWRRCSS
eukprot:scaffold7946_cov403-Prasinococcus_capsulatus_cf.AAC.5